MIRPIAIVLTIVFSVLFVIATINRSVVYTMRGTGRPFDHMGEFIKCQLCAADTSRCTTGYNYQCETCRKEFRARWNEGERKIDINW
ncbi:MAG: hypothetical protein Q8K78_13760 [Planctomycetaceae bacterium]|nr:hypothetical protein [Planctomycetaceae bacterium]